jgi:heme exporter protein A
MTPSGAPLVEVRGLGRRFGTVRALRSVDLAIGPGEVVLLAGPNGAGKSTLLRSLAGLSRADTGSVRILDRALAGNPAARSAVGFLSHQSFLYDDLTARENLRFAATLHGISSSESELTALLDAAGLLQAADTRTGTLSHGLQQRLAIARATLHAPVLLLLDEPFTGLDAASSDLLRRRIADDRAGGRTVVCVTHQPAEIWELTTRVVVLARGAVVFDGPRPGSLDEFAATYRGAIA